MRRRQARRAGIALSVACAVLLLAGIPLGFGDDPDLDPQAAGRDAVRRWLEVLADVPEETPPAVLTGRAPATPAMREALKRHGMSVEEFVRMAGEIRSEGLRVAAVEEPLGSLADALQGVPLPDGVRSPAGSTSRLREALIGQEGQLRRLRGTGGAR